MNKLLQILTSRMHSGNGCSLKEKEKSFLKKHEDVFYTQKTSGIASIFVTVILSVLLISATVITAGVLKTKLVNPQKVSDILVAKTLDQNISSDILGESAASISGTLRINVPTIFTNTVSISNSDLTTTTLTADSITGTDITASSVTASNLLYSITSGNGISVSSGQNPTVTNTGVLSLGGSTGVLNLTAGTDISISGLTITNTATLSSVTGRGGCSACITASDVASNLNISGGTVNNTPIGASSPSTGVFTTLTASSIGGSLIPSSNGSYDLGSSTYQWGTIYATNLDVSGVNSAGQLISTYVPTSNTVSTGPLYVNPTTANAGYTLAGFAVGGNAKLLITAEGSLIPGSDGGADLGTDSIRFNNLYVNSLTASGTNYSGQASFTYQPTSSAIGQGSIWINPTTATAAYPLLSISVGGAEKARITTDGYLGLGGANDPGSSYFINAGSAFNVSTAGRLTATGVTNLANGAASTPAQTLSGTWFTGGTSTTTKPQLLIEPSGTTSTAWSTSGTGLGVNAASGFAGNLADLQIAGTSYLKVNNSGTIVSGITAASSKPIIDTATGDVQLFARNGTNVIRWGAGGIGSGLDFVLTNANLNLAGSSNNSVLWSDSGRIWRNGVNRGLSYVATNINTYSAEQPDWDWQAGTLIISSGFSTQRFHKFAQPTISAASALTITNADTLNIAGAPISAGSAAITNAVGLRISSGTSVASGVTNAYGLYVDAPTGASNNYAATFASGNVGIGTTSPAYALDVSGSIRSSALSTSTAIPFVNSSNGALAESGLCVSGGGVTFGRCGANTIQFTATNINYNTYGGWYHNFNQSILGSSNGAASYPAQTLSGTWFSGGTSTTTKPQLLIEPSGTTSTGWSTSGTGLGINAASGFSGNLLDLQVAGTSYFKVNSSGLVTFPGGSGAFQLNTANNNGLRVVSNGSADVWLEASGNNRSIFFGNNDGGNTTYAAFNISSSSFTPTNSTGTTTSSGLVLNANSITSGTGFYATSSSITTGKLAQLSTGSANTLTTGTLLDVRSTATSLTGTAGIGSFINLDWSPGSATTATGDLFALNIGANGTTTGNLFNILDSGSSIFSISETALTSSLPTNFTSPGDVGIAYDINFTNPTASFIKSSAPITIVAGETFNSSNLTLQTYNQGTIVLSPAATTGTGVQLQANSLTTGNGLTITSSSLTSGKLVNITPNFAGSAVTGYGIYNDGTDSTATANTDYGYWGSLALSGNAAKTGYGLYQTLTTSSTTADTLYSAYLATSATGVIGSGTRTNTALYLAPASTSANTGGTQNMYGIYSVPSSTLAAGSTENVYGGYFGGTATVASGTINRYGLYVASASMNTTGTSSQYGLYIANQTGADINYGIYNAHNGAASSPAEVLAGTWYSGGSSTTTKPQLLIEPSGTTSTNWSTSGTGLGINAASGFAGNLFDFKINNSNTDRLTGSAGSNSFTLTFGAFAQVTANNRFTIDAGSYGTNRLQMGQGNETSILLQHGSYSNVTAETSHISISNSFSTRTLTGSFSTQRNVYFPVETFTAASTQTITTGSTLNIGGAPTVSGSAVITNTYGLQVGGATTIAGASSSTYGAIDIPAHTVTTNTQTQITSTPGIAGMRIGQITVAQSGGAVTVDNAASLYIANAPTAGASVTLSNSYALLTGGGAVKFTCDGAGLTGNPASCSDYAEVYETNDSSLEKGDLVIIASGNEAISGKVAKSNSSYQKQLVGVYSASPGVLIGPDGIISGGVGNLGGGKIPVALSGRVPVKVSLENGSIQAGDYLTSSSTPGVAMKATKPGQVIGKALEDFSGPGISKILVFVNVGFADPNDVLANLSLDDNGNLVSSKALITPDVLLSDHSVIPTAVEGSQDSSTDSSLTLTPTSLGAGGMTSLKDQIASISARLSSLEASLSAQESTDSANLAGLGLNTPSGLTSSDASISGQLTAYNLSVQNSFKSLGETVLGVTTIAGDLTVDGTLSIGTDSISTLGTLYIQNNSLASLVDLFNGAVTISKQGEIMGKSITVDEVKVTGKTKGTGTIVSGTDNVIINNSYVATNSAILLTPKTKTPRILSVTEQLQGISFKVEADATPSSDINFAYWIINEAP